MALHEGQADVYGYRVFNVGLYSYYGGVCDTTQRVYGAAAAEQLAAYSGREGPAGDKRGIRDAAVPFVGCIPQTIPLSIGVLSKKSQNTLVVLVAMLPQYPPTPHPPPSRRPDCRPHE